MRCIYRDGTVVLARRRSRSMYRIWTRRKENPSIQGLAVDLLSDTAGS